jgi:predicted phosphoribosyltransferase
MKRYPTPAAAGRELAESLTEFTSAKNTIVVAIATGGVGVAAKVASELELPFELLFIRRLLAPSGPQNVLCGLNVAGTLVLDEGIPSLSDGPATGLEHAIADGLEQLTELARVCRANEPLMDLRGKTVILVDNGIHTGSTVLIAVAALRKLSVARVVVAVPVADANSRATIESAADQVVCLAWPEKFGHVGMWYAEFVRPSEDEIMRLYKGDNEWVSGRQKPSLETI